MICIQTERRYIWPHSIGYSISTSPAPIIYFGPFQLKEALLQTQSCVTGVMEKGQ